MKQNREAYLKTILAVATLISLSFAFTSNEVSLQKKWQTDSTFKTPESVIYDAERKILYVANINGDGSAKDGNGFISQLTTSGKIQKLEWVKGMDAPKGMGIYDNKLFVADITNITIIDIPSSKILKKIEVPNSKFLNDISIDIKGNVYITDSETKKIHLLHKDKVTEWVTSTDFKKPNGLLAKKDGLRYIDMGSGDFYNISYADKKLNITAHNILSGDGIVEIAADEYLISNWNGEINSVKGSVVKKILDTKNEKINAADIWYLEDEKLLLIPTFFKNTIVAYHVSK